ncbi:MAG: hypothetical protein K5663_01950 [Clostridiales bacterium]|nr:hypothetical protein [Clostridiales bacterium]
MKEGGRQRLWRVVKLMLVDAFIIVVCAYAALLTKFAPNIDKEELLALNRYLPAIVLVYIVSFSFFRMYRVIWRYSDALALIRQCLAVVVGFGMTFVANIIMEHAINSRPLSGNFLIILCSFIITGIGAFRLCLKMFKRETGETGFIPELRRVMIVGAGDAGSHIIEMFSLSREGMGQVVCLVDDDPAKQGLIVNNVKVSGTSEDIPALAEKHYVTDIIIAIPTLSEERSAQLSEICLKTGCFVRTLDKIKTLESE